MHTIHCIFNDILYKICDHSFEIYYCTSNMTNLYCISYIKINN